MTNYDGEISKEDRTWALRVLCALFFGAGLIAGLFVAATLWVIFGSVNP